MFTGPWSSQGHLKTGAQLFGKNTDRVSLDWNSPLREGHSSTTLKRHYKIANKSDSKKCDLVWEQKTGQDDKVKNIFKCTMDHGDCRSACQVNMTEMTQEGTGLIWKDGDSKAHFGMKSVWNYKNNTTVNAASLHYGGKAFGETARAFIHTDIAAKFTDLVNFDSAAMLNQWWIVDGDVSVGLRWEHCLKENNLKNPKALRLEGQYTINSTDAVWGHVAFMNKFAALAYDHTWLLAGINWRNTAMLTCAWEKSGDTYQQMRGTPFGFRIGHEAQFSKEMKVIANWGYSSRSFFNCTMNTNMKKNWMIGVHYHYDHNRRENEPINLGVDIHYKCDDLLDITN